MASSRTQKPDDSEAAFRPSIVRVVAVVLGAVALGWLAFAVSVAGFARTSNPELAAQIAPFDAVATGERAYGLMEAADTPAGRAAARTLATDALMRDPTAVGAARTLGLVADAEDHRDQASKLFTYAEKISRRDFATQLWLIDERVNADDTAGALNHFDKALRTSKLAASVLLPILVSATEDPRLIPALAGRLAQNPPWGSAYLQALITSGKSLDNITALFERVASRDHLRQMVGRTAGEKRPDLAARLFVRAGGHLGEPVNGFGGGDAFLPLDWEFLNTGPVLANVVRDNDRSVLDFTVTSPGSSADIARKMLTLKPGVHYALNMVGVLDTTSASPAFTIDCVESPINLVTVGMTRDRSTQRAGFAVPTQGCAFQWLRLNLSSRGGAGDAGGRVEALSVTPD